MKKINCILILFLLLMTFGCTKNQNDNDFYDGEIAKNPISKLESEMIKNNLDYEKIPLSSNGIGAKECYYYYFEKEELPLIVYYFDENNDNYKKIASTGYIENKSDDTTNNIQVIYSKGLVIEKNNILSHFNTIEKILKNI